MHTCTSATVTMHICTVTVSSCIWYIYFSLSPPHSLFFSLVWLSPQAHFSSTDLRCSLRSRHNCATTDHLTRYCSHWLLLLTPIAATLPIAVAIFFSVWWFWYIDQWVLMVSCSTALSSLSTAVPPPITSLAATHANCRCLANRYCSRRLPLLSFFLCLMVLGFWSVGFD